MTVRPSPFSHHGTQKAQKKKSNRLESEYQVKHLKYRPGLVLGVTKTKKKKSHALTILGLQGQKNSNKHNRKESCLVKGTGGVEAFSILDSAIVQINMPKA